MMQILLACVKKDIPSIPVHDSVIVPHRHRHVVEKIMRHVYRMEMGFDIIVESG